jgi:hypothetical protein
MQREIDWENCAKNMSTLIPAIRRRLDALLSTHPTLRAEISNPANVPYKAFLEIRLWFVQANRTSRKVNYGMSGLKPARLAKLKQDELDIPATFIGEIAEYMDLHARFRGNDGGLLIYTLGPKNLPKIGQ